MSKEKNKSDFKAKSITKLQEWGVLAVEIPVSAAEMVLTLELNLERDKTGDVGKFHDTNIILISKFMITHDHTLLLINFQSIFAIKTVWPFVVEIFLFNVYYGKLGLYSFDDSYVDGFYLLNLNQEAVHISVPKKCRLLWTCTGFVFKSSFQ